MSKLTIAALNNMSDEDFDKLDPNELFGEEDNSDGDNQSGQDNSQGNDSDDDSHDDDDDNQDPDKDSNSDDDDSHEDDSQDDDDSNDDDEGNDHQEEEEENGDKQEGTKNTDNQTKAKEQKADSKDDSGTAEVSAEVKNDFYAKVTSQFKANGKTYQVQSPEEAVSLMQKGLNYQAKMNNIKHLTRAGRVLEEHDLLNDPDKLAFLIDLHNKKPEAIAKLVKESGIDSYELDDEKANNYKPTPVQVPDDNILELQEIIASHKGDADFETLYGDVTGWDDASQKLVLDTPSVLNTLLEHKRNGFYDAVMQRVNHAIDVQGSKMPAANLYYQFSQQMLGNGGNNNNAQADQREQPAPETKLTKKVDPELDRKRKAISGVKSSTSNKGKVKKVSSPEELFNLSDEDFDNLKPEDLN